MQVVVTQLLALPIIMLFSLLPGAWVAYGLPLPAIRWPARLALSGALSPVILALQMLLFKAGGVPFAFIPNLLLLLNLPALWLLWRTERATQRAKGDASVHLAGGSLVAMLALYLLVPWHFVQNLRPFAWHALWQTDITYALTRDTLLPEEPELAGMTLAYGWIGHIYWSVVGWSTNLPPTVTYPISNLLWLLFTCVLAYELARMGLRLGRPAALLSVGLTCLGTNVVGAVAWLAQRDWHWQQYYLGDVRYTPLLNKFLGFETMPFAFALLLAVALLSSIALQQVVPDLAAPLALSLTGLGLIYPILFPVGSLLAGVMWLLLATRLARATPVYRWRTLGWIAAGIVVSALLTEAFLVLVTQDRSDGVMRITGWQEMQPKVFHLLSALLLFIPATLTIALGLRQRSATVLLLTLATLGTMALYVITDLARLEYKYMLAATIVVAPLAAAGIARLLQRLPTIQWGVTFTATLALVLLHQLLILQVGAQIPTNLVNAPKLQENGFWLSLTPDHADADWTTAIRTQTPLNTVVVTNQSPIHLGAFVARALYAPSDGNGEQISGYSVDQRFNLLTWRGYPAQLYEERQAVINTLYHTTVTSEMQRAIAALLTLQRPVALHFTPDLPVYQWLHAKEIGRAVFTSTTEVVWLLTPAAIAEVAHHVGQ